MNTAYLRWQKSKKKQRPFVNAADRPKLSFVHVVSLLAFVSIVSFYGYSLLRMFFFPKEKLLEIANARATQTVSVKVTQTKIMDFVELLTPKVSEKNVEVTPSPTTTVVFTEQQEYTEITIPEPDLRYNCAYGFRDGVLVVECRPPSGRTDVRSTPGAADGPR